LLRLLLKPKLPIKLLRFRRRIPILWTKCGPLTCHIILDKLNPNNKLNKSKRKIRKKSLKRKKIRRMLNLMRIPPILRMMMMMSRPRAKTLRRKRQARNEMNNSF